MMDERQTQELLIRIDERTGSTIEKVNKLFELRERDIEESKRVQRDNNRRIALLEKWRAGIVAVLGFVAVVLGLLAKVVL